MAVGAMGEEAAAVDLVAGLEQAKGNEIKLQYVLEKAETFTETSERNRLALLHARVHPLLQAALVPHRYGAGVQRAAIMIASNLAVSDAPRSRLLAGQWHSIVFDVMRHTKSEQVQAAALLSLSVLERLIGVPLGHDFKHLTADSCFEGALHVGGDGGITMILTVMEEFRFSPTVVGNGFRALGNACVLPSLTNRRRFNLVQGPARAAQLLAMYTDVEHVLKYAGYACHNFCINMESIKSSFIPSTEVFVRCFRASLKHYPDLAKSYVIFLSLVRFVRATSASERYHIMLNQRFDLVSDLERFMALPQVEEDAATRRTALHLTAWLKSPSSTNPYTHAGHMAQEWAAQNPPPPPTPGPFDVPDNP